MVALGRKRWHEETLFVEAEQQNCMPNAFKKSSDLDALKGLGR